MSLIQLIFRNLVFFRKRWLALFAGIAVSTAVITGALVVGDSVKYSLLRLTDERLGKIRFAIQTSDRFFRQELADELSGKLRITVAPALLTECIAINSDRNLRINQVQVIGMDSRFSRLWDGPPVVPGDDETVISRNVAEKLGLKRGDQMLLRIQKMGKTPSNAPFVSENTPSVSVRLKISAIAEENQMGRFSLKNNQASPFTVFLPLHKLAGLLELQGNANLLLAPDNDDHPLNIRQLDSVLRRSLKPADAGIVIRQLPETEICQVTTGRVFFDDSTAKAVMSAIPGCETILTYLANSISGKGGATPYSFVSAGNESFFKKNIGNRAIIINDWLASDIHARPGDSVALTYYRMGPLRTLHEDSMRFTVSEIMPMGGEIAGRELMPDFPGMSGAGNCRDWDAGAPVDMKKIRDKDEKYWKDYRGTPKAYISMEAGKLIWANKFGSYTAFRFQAEKKDLPGIERSLMSRINPAWYGLRFSPVYKEGRQAAMHSTDFAELFLSLSFFIVAGALLLSGMLFSQLAQARMAESGILSAIGFRKRQVLAILSGEAFLVALAGAVAGSVLGILYNYFLILGLNTVWKEAVNTPLLVMQVRIPALFTGFVSGAVTSLTVLTFVLLKNLRKPLSELVKNSTGIRVTKYNKSRFTCSMVVVVACFGAALAIMLRLMISGQASQNSLLLLAGGLILPGGLALLNLLLVKKSRYPVKEIPGLTALTIKNLALNRGRTITAVALLALGTFTIIITGANRKTADGDENSMKSGTGGFLLWSESTLPVMNSLNTASGKAKYGLNDEPVLQTAEFIQLTSLDGDDASCLNLNQVSQPKLLGVPPGIFDRRNAFTFAATDRMVDKAHPWKALSAGLSGDVIPGFADMSVIKWGLRKSPGDTLLYRAESGKVLKIKLVGGLDNSIFQGHILVSDSLLRLYYPSMAGSRIMLTAGSILQQNTIAQTLETLFRDYGMTAIPASERLASFNAVENTYLSVFMLLGGMGVIIGTVGLGIVLVANIARRRREFALYGALGFSKKFIFRLILAEHLVVLLAGLFLGTFSACAGIIPMLYGPKNNVPWIFITGILLAVLANGFLWIYFPARKIISRNFISGLRVE